MSDGTTLPPVPSRRVPKVGENGYERLANDAYETPPWVTEALLNTVRFPSKVWEPACGSGKMAEVMKARRYEVTASDIVLTGDYGQRGLDFLKVLPEAVQSDAIITNPPYSHAQQFIQKALDLMEPRLGMVAMLLRHEYDCAAGRAHLFKHPAFAMKITLTKRPQWIEPKEGEKNASPRFNFSWFVWCWRSFGTPPTMRWV